MSSMPGLVALSMLGVVVAVMLVQKIDVPATMCHFWGLTAGQQM